MGPRMVLVPEDRDFPEALRSIPHTPEQLYVLGNPAAMREGLAVVGARNATPYGLAMARRFSSLAASRGIVVISGGARGCDSAAHESALEAGGQTVVFCGGGCDWVYPSRNRGLFQRVIDGGGALVSEYPWDTHPEPFMFRQRNRLIAGLSKATLIVEAGLPSGTFSTADEALQANREVWAVPGAITSPKSAGANSLIAQGATPIIDDESFLTALFLTFGVMRIPGSGEDQSGDSAELSAMDKTRRWLLDALRSQPMTLEALMRAHSEGGTAGFFGVLLSSLTALEEQGLVQRFGDGRYGCVVASLRR